ncbi:MAG TPA: pyridoxamine 5'-phosphate oxidase [Actinomycetota bacterium]|nr:pyridoxamine 5'-phosphate oxidase [Actinomycetota bacterium]
MTPGHGGPGLSETDLGADPVARFLAWQEEARAAGIAFPEAAALGTADADRRPAVRYVLVKAVDERGFTFFTNRESRKARHLAENPNAALAFYWREVDRQVCVTGAAAPIADDESAAYFRTRPREARIGAWASMQSRPVGSREELDAAYAAAAARFPDDDVPLPPHWGGYRLEPDAIEFWKGREHRLHDRFRYTREGASWRLERLWP